MTLSSSDRLVQHFAATLAAGAAYDSIVQARTEAADILGQPVHSGTALAKQIEEAVEAGLVQAAQQIVADSGLDRLLAFDQLVDLYERQPNLATRSSTSIRDQAYSTPVPVGFVVAMLAQVDRETTVYEPTAGHGALLLGASPQRVVCNEINPARADVLEKQGYRVTREDAITYRPLVPVDIVVMNPPFGTVTDPDGFPHRWPVSGGAATAVYNTTQMDHAICLNALGAMKDSGRAVILLGAPLSNKVGNPERSAKTYNTQQKRAFYKSLYDNYNVTEHFCIAGNLYRRQGTTFPVDAIVVAGRGYSKRALPAADLPRVYDQFSQLRGYLDAALSRTSLSLAAPNALLTSSRIDRRVQRQESTDSEAGELSAVARGEGGGADSSGGSPGGRLRADLSGVESGHLLDASNTGAQRLGDPVGGVRDALQHPTSGESDEPACLGYGGNSNVDGVSAAAPALDSGNSGADPKLDSRSLADLDALSLSPGVVDIMDMERVTSPDTGGTKDSAAQVPYLPHSAARPFETLVPANMQTAVSDALMALEQRVGLVDEYVAAQLQLDDVSALHERFGAEQVDALGLAFSNLQQQQSFIIGDQTGVGKGRFVAAVIEYTRQRGLIPIFVTQDKNLYADMFRDLYDIGVDDLHPLVTDSALCIPRPDGSDVRTPSQAVHGRLLQEMATRGELGEFDAVFTTYSQLQTVRGQETSRRELLRQLASQSVLILDESHNAGGTKKNQHKAFAVPDRADFIRQLVEDADGVVYSSATYAKNPYTMTLYAAKTGMQEVAQGDDLVEMVQAGGVPLQQMIASKLAQAGQYIRRERSYDGIEFEARVAPVDHPVAENMARAMSLVMAFDEAKTEGLHKLDDALRAEARQRNTDNSIGSPGATSTNFTSVMHNLINQSLLGLKAEAAVQTALESLRKGEKPVIALSNTMGSFIQTVAQEQDLSPGDPIVLSIGDMLRRYLDRSREVMIKDYVGAVQRQRLSDRELGAAGVLAYEAAQTFIDAASWGNTPISPIDYIRFRLEQEGYTTGEITGRQHRVEYQVIENQAEEDRADTANKTLAEAVLYRLRGANETSTSGKRAAVDGFNSGEIDALIINRSGSTGISLHASERFSDQRPRRMIVAQPDLNIDVFIQTLGRVHRTGQVVKPAFTLLMGDIPAEKRPAAVLLKKMASLNANTTAARESGFSLGQITDFMNAYGDQVAVELMVARPDLHGRLGRPIQFLAEESDKERHDFAGAISKLTGRIPLLSIAEQEQVYSLIEHEYLELVAREEAMGQSILKAETLDLNARTTARMEVRPGDAGGNPFTEPVYLEVMDVKALRKPMTTLEVVNAVRGAVGWEAILAVGDHDPQALEVRAIQQTTRELDAASSALSEYKTAFESNARNQPKFRSLDPEQRQAFFETRLQHLDQQIEAQTLHLKRTLEQFPIGQSVRLQSEKDGTVYYGVIEQVIHQQADGANPMSPAAWKLQIQVADSMGKLRMPISKINAAAPSGISLRAQATTSFGGQNIYQLFDQRQSLAKEQRQIFTGNVIRALSSYKGKLINFTDSEGQVRQGLLMAQGFDITDTLEQQPVLMPDGDRALEFLRLNGREGHTRLKSKDERLLVHLNRNTLFLNTERSKSTGGRYYLDEDLLEVAQAEFVSTSSTMKLRVEGEQIPEVLAYLYDNDRPLYAFDQRGLARQILGLKMPELIEVLPEGVEKYSPTLQELRDWLQDARINERSPGYVERIEELSIEMLADTQQAFLMPRQRNPRFRNSKFSLSQPAQQAMQQDQTASQQRRTPNRKMLLTWYDVARYSGQSQQVLEQIRTLGQQQIAGTVEEQKAPAERDPLFVNPSFVLSRQDYRQLQVALASFSKADSVAERAQIEVA